MGKNKNKFFKITALFSFVFILAVIFLFADFSYAQPQLGLENEFAEEVELETTDIRIIIARIIRAFIGVLGIIAVVLIIYGGFVWMTSRGDEEKVSKAKKILINATIGLIIILLAFSIVQFILSRLYDIYGPGPVGPEIEGPPPSGALGGGIIEDHYPPRGAAEIPRNTKIIITFKEPMMIDSLVNSQGTPDDKTDDTINTSNIKIRRTIDDSRTGPFVENVLARYTEDKKIFVFDPIDLLGSATENTSYTVLLSSGISKANGSPAFGAVGTYSWNFEVSTFVDAEPPKVNSTVPVAGDLEPRNTIVQLNFNEAIDPTTLGNVDVSANGEVLSGAFEISNQYRTIEFLSDSKCEGVEKNSCGEPVYCLPANSEILTLVKAATLSDNPPEAEFTAAGYNGITDVAGNSFDGNKNGQAQGPEFGPPYSENNPDSDNQGDNYQFIFDTSDEIDLIPPVVEEVAPLSGAEEVALDAPVNVLFSKLMMSSSLRTDNIGITDFAPYWITKENDAANEKTTVFINHGFFDPETTYTPMVTSNVKDTRQNCFNPCVGP